MKAIIYDTENMRSNIRVGKATITFRRKTETTLSQDLVKAMKLEAGEHICIIQDEEKPDHWYLGYSNEPYGFKLRKPKNHHGNAMVFSNSQMANHFIDYLNDRYIERIKWVALEVETKSEKHAVGEGEEKADLFRIKLDTAVCEWEMPG